MPILSDDRNAHITPTDFHSIANDVSDMKQAIREMASAITQIAVIDAKMLSQQQSIERAFQEVTKLSDTLQRHIDQQNDRALHREALEQEAAEAARKAADFVARENSREHDQFKTVLNRAYGAVGLAYILLTCFGGYAISVITDLGNRAGKNEQAIYSLQNDVRHHVDDDKLRNEKDLRQMLHDINEPRALK